MSRKQKIVFCFRKMTLLFLAILCLNLTNCDSQSSSSKPKYPRSIGDIQPDPTSDDPNFEPCSSRRAVQYFAFGEKTFEGEKIKIIRTFEQQYKAEEAAKESGLIRVRFLVNCKGQAGRFRIMGMNENYQEKRFDKSITDQLLRITKGLKGWKTFPDKNRDYYQYLIFKMKDGEIVEIMP